MAKWLIRRLENGRSVAVIAAGERWGYDDSLLPALEDQLGAGAILSSMVDLGCGEHLSPAAWSAVELFEAGLGRLDERVRNCVGGRELASKGFRSVVDVAAGLNASAVVPVHTGGAFMPAA